MGEPLTTRMVEVLRWFSEGKRLLLVRNTDCQGQYLLDGEPVKVHGTTMYGLVRRGILVAVQDDVSVTEFMIAGEYQRKWQVAELERIAANSTTDRG